ncbi:hypothetical protein [Geoglobus acetivorans]
MAASLIHISEWREENHCSTPSAGAEQFCSKQG